MKRTATATFAATMTFVLSAGTAPPATAQANDPTIHDGEFEVLRKQHGERWDQEDGEIDEMLAAIRAKHEGKPPNILYILIDDIGFGQMGNRTLNAVIGVDTPNINQFADESLSLMRMYTEPSCTPTRTALMTGRHPIRSGADEVKKLGIAENTLVVLMSDNGPMHAYSSTVTGLTELVYRGGKTQHLEGGVRVDAFVRWPGVIEEDAIARDIVHVSDLYSTFARLGQASKHIPRDRVIDGIDQTALLLKGENHGRRDYVYIYEGSVLRSVVKREFKMHLPAPGVPGVYAGVFNVLRDPREQDAFIGQSLWSGASFQNMIKRHQLTIARYPHAKLGKGRPYEGIENLRPETVEAVEHFMSWQSGK